MYGVPKDCTFLEGPFDTTSRIGRNDGIDYVWIKPPANAEPPHPRNRFVLLESNQSNPVNFCWPVSHIPCTPRTMTNRCQKKGGGSIDSPFLNHQFWCHFASFFGSVVFVLRCESNPGMRKYHPIPTNEAISFKQNDHSLGDFCWWLIDRKVQYHEARYWLFQPVFCIQNRDSAQCNFLQLV